MAACTVVLHETELPGAAACSLYGASLFCPPIHRFHMKFTATRRQSLRIAMWSWLACQSRLLAESELPRLNLIAREDSGYLRREAKSGIEWRPWGAEALEEAVQLNRPLFISIGYHSCHWCRRVDEQVFGNEEVVRVLNDSCIPVKIDRFERPDLDRLYMLYQEVTNRRSGWPLNLWLTPEGLPIRGFAVGASNRKVEQFLKTADHTARWWQAEAESTRQQARNRMLLLNERVTLKPAPPTFEITRELVVRAFGQISAQFDPVNGGFGKVPKFMAPARLELIALTASGSQSASLRAEEAKQIVTTTLRGMARGGLRDQLDGGFFRYAMDVEWRRPYFEKMALDQALVVRSYLTGWLLTRDEEFAVVARETLAYVDRELGHPEGAFYNAEACDSLPAENSTSVKEGAAYTWTLEEVRRMAGAEAPLLEAVFGLRERGNLPVAAPPLDEGVGQENLLFIERTPLEAARALGWPVAEAQRRFEAGCAALRTARRQRPRPARDPLLITQVTSALASSFIRAGMVLDDPALVERGTRALLFVRQQLWDELSETLYRCRSVRGPRYRACAEDYAATVEAALTLYEATGAHEWLVWAEQVQRVFDRLHEDAENGGYYDAASSATDVVLRLKTFDDASQISPNALAGLNLVRWAVLLPSEAREQKARRQIAAFHQPLSSQPGSAAGLVLAAETYLRRPARVVWVGPREAPGAMEIRKRVWMREITRPALIHLSDSGCREWWASREGLPTEVLRYNADKEPAFFVIRPSGQVAGPFPAAQLESHWPEPW